MKEAMKKVCIIGCGAIGSLYAAHLARVAEVWAFVRREDHAAELNRGGLRVTGTHNFAVPLKATTNAKDLPDCDLGIVATKATQVKESFRLVGRHFDKGAVLSAQNGVGSEEIIATLTRGYVIRATTFMSGTRHSDTHVQYELDTPTWMGPFEPTGTPFSVVKEAADLIVAADGVNSRIRDGLGLLSERRYLRDGCTRVLIPARGTEEGLDSRTIEYWSGHRRLLYNPCSTTHLYLALSMPHDDVPGRALPVNRALWIQSFPHLRELIERIGDDGRYDRFEYITLKRWSAGRIAVIGDAAHALPPNIGQGAGCAMMNALSLGVFLERGGDVPNQLQAWERAERPLTDHSQRISRLYGMPTFWPAPLRRLFYAAAGRSRWLTEQRTRTARHIPTGTT